MKMCTSSLCPERKSICCNAISKAVSGDEGTGYFACSSCGKEYIGGECTAGPSMTNLQELQQEARKEMLIGLGDDGQFLRVKDILIEDFLDQQIKEAYRAGAEGMKKAIIERYYDRQNTRGFFSETEAANEFLSSL